MRFWEAKSRMRLDDRVAPFNEAPRGSTLCGLAFNESAVKSSKYYVDGSMEGEGNWGAREGGAGSSVSEVARTVTGKRESRLGEGRRVRLVN